jgi:hypothetical protein
MKIPSKKRPHPSKYAGISSNILLKKRYVITSNDDKKRYVITSNDDKKRDIDCKNQFLFFINV